MPYLPPLTQKTKKKKKNYKFISQYTSPPTIILIYKIIGSHLVMIKINKKQSLH